MQRRPDKLEQFHLERLKGLGCLVCGAEAVVHHLMRAPERAWRWTVPICPKHHNMGNDSVHLCGNELKWFSGHGFPDIIGWAKAEWETSKRLFWAGAA